MRKLLMRALALTLCLLLCLPLLTGCSSTDQLILTVDGHEVTRGMFNFFVVQASEFFADVYLEEGEPLDPRKEYNGRTLGDMVIDYACQQLANEYAMLRIGRDHGIAFNEDRLAAAREELAELKAEYGVPAIRSYCERYHMSEEDYVRILALFTAEDDIQEALFGEKGALLPDSDTLSDALEEYRTEIYHVQYVMLDKKTASGADNAALAESVRDKLMVKDADIEKIVDEYSINGDPDMDNDVYMKPVGDVSSSALGALPVGGVSEVIAEGDYYYIFVQLAKNEEVYLKQYTESYCNELLEDLMEKAVNDLEVTETAAFDRYSMEQL